MSDESKNLGGAYSQRERKIADAYTAIQDAYGNSVEDEADAHLKAAAQLVDMAADALPDPVKVRIVSPFADGPSYLLPGQTVAEAIDRLKPRFGFKDTPAVMLQDEDDEVPFDGSATTEEAGIQPGDTLEMVNTGGAV